MGGLRIRETSAPGAQRTRQLRRQDGWLVQGRRLTRRGVVLIVALVIVVALVGLLVVRILTRPLLVDGFDQPNGLITNEFAAYNPGDRAAVQSPVWIATSGSLFARDGTGWTGVPDTGTPGPRSLHVTDSAVFRIVTKNDNFQDVSVSFSLFVQRFMSGQGGAMPSFQGVHVFLRYQNPDLLYVVSVDRRDGIITIKKKVPGGPSAGGTYYTLAQVHGKAAVGRWEQVTTSVVNNGEGGVNIKVWLDGHFRLSAVDNGVGDAPPITDAGRVGLRGDYTEFRFDNFTVASA